MLGEESMKSLCRAIIWSACFLELSEDDIVDPDSAVKALEDIASALQDATKEEKAALVLACVEEADRLVKEAGPGYTKAAEFVRSLPGALGL
jgi:hypothetical protein